MKKSMHLGLHEYFEQVSSLSDLAEIKRSTPMRNAEETYWKNQQEEAVLQEFDGHQGYLYFIDILLEDERHIPFEIDHADLHILYVLSDSGPIKLYNQDTHLLSKVANHRAQYLYLPPEDYHIALPPGKSTIFGFYFRASIFRDGNDTKYTFLHPLLDAYRSRSPLPKCSIDFRVGPITQLYIETLCRNLVAKQLHNESFILERLIQLIELSKQKVHEEYDHEDTYKNLIYKYINIIKAHVDMYGQNFSLQEVAEKMGFSESHMSHILKRQTGIPAKQYKDRFVLERCRKELLAYGQVGDAAERCGFSSAAAFSKFFKKHTGETPGAFRNR
jgi:AraC-like DNA-binding protein